MLIFEIQPRNVKLFLIISIICKITESQHYVKCRLRAH